MSITDELREAIATLEVRLTHNDHDSIDIFYPSPSRREFAAIADRIDAEHEQMQYDFQREFDEWKHDRDACWVKLPVDADGEVIHVRDKLDGYGKTITVVEMRYGRSGWVLISEYGNAYADCFAFTHHHAPTVEDVLEELLREYDRDDSELTNGEIIEMYAQRLRLREVDE